MRTVRELVAGFRGLSGTAKQKAVLADLGMARTSLEDLVVDHRLDRDRLDRLLKAMQAESRAVKAAALGVIGRDHLLARLPLTDLGRESFAYRKRVDDDPGNPRVAETAFAFDDDALAGRLLLVGLNNSTALSDAGAFRELGVDGLGGLLGAAVRGRGGADRLRPAPDGRPPVASPTAASPRWRSEEEGRPMDAFANGLLDDVEKVTRKWADQNRRENPRGQRAGQPAQHLRAVDGGSPCWTRPARSWRRPT